MVHTPPVMPSLTDSSRIQLVMEDFDAAFAFYVEAIGAEVAQLGQGTRGQRFALLRVAGALEFLLAESGAIPEFETGVTEGLCLVIPHPDVRGARDVLVRRMKAFSDGPSELEETPLGLAFTLSAPGGEQLMFLQVTG